MTTRTLFDKLWEREQLGSTAIGGGIAIPHCKVDRLKSGVVGARPGREGVDFGAADGQPVRLFFLVISPSQSPAEHLQILAAISRWIKGGGRARRCSSSRTPRPSTSTCSGKADHGGTLVHHVGARGRAAQRGARLSASARPLRRVAPRQPDHAPAGPEAGARLRRLLRLHQAGARADHRRERDRVPEDPGRRGAAPAARHDHQPAGPGLRHHQGARAAPRLPRALPEPRGAGPRLARSCRRPSSRGSATSWRTTWSPRPRCTACCWRSTAWASS